MKARRMPSFAALAVIFAIALASPAEAGQVGGERGDAQGRRRAFVPRAGISKNPSCVANRKVKLLEVAPEPAQIDFVGDAYKIAAWLGSPCSPSSSQSAG
ncbi:MAG TPA: hypothetical protein VFY33_00495, partial [Solirubrobacterales bacterium]|nr:hypothetical protein [Solirubrobacterales bacterium]